MTATRMTGLALAAALIAAPALAQNAGTGPGTTAPGAGSTAPAVGTTSPATAPPATGATPPAAVAANTPTPNPVLTADGQIRTSKVIGASVYNDKDQDLATVNDVLLGKDGKASQAVLSIGGVLGVGGKYVAVPFDKLQFPAQLSGKQSRVMMPGETTDALKGMPEFHYASK